MPLGALVSAQLALMGGSGCDVAEDDAELYISSIAEYSAAEWTYSSGCAFSNSLSVSAILCRIQLLTFSIHGRKSSSTRPDFADPSRSRSRGDSLLSINAPSTSFGYNVSRLLPHEIRTASKTGTVVN